MTVVFPSHQQFEIACRAFMQRQEQRSRTGNTEAGKQFGAQSGWRWQEHSVHAHNGYMSRRDIRAIRRPSNGDDEESSAFDPMEEGDEEEEEEEDPSSAARHPSTPDAGDSSHFVEVHWDIVYAKTYRIPQLLFTVSDSTGTPLSLSEVIAAGVIFHHSRAPPGTRIHKDHMDLLHPDGNGGASSDSSSSGYGMEGAEFPLLQRVYHPYPRNEPGSNYAQEIVWSVHPCHVQETIEEILAASQPGGTYAVNSVGIDDNSDNDPQAAHIQWLECWFMVMSTLINLRS